MTNLTPYQIADLLNRPGPLWLVGIDLSVANLSIANLIEANLIEANLIETILSKANLHGPT